MFTQAAVRKSAIAAIVLTVLVILASFTLLLTGNPVVSRLSIASTGFILWAAVMAYRLTGYEYKPDNYKEISLRINAILVYLVLYFFVGRVAGLLIAILILASLSALKRKMDGGAPDEGEGDDARSINN